MSNTWTTKVDASRRKPNAFHLSGSVTVQKPVETVFNFITKDLSAYYPQTAEGHKKLEVIGSDRMTEGAKIECQEISKNVEVHHLYQITDVVPNKKAYFSTSLPSNPTRAYVYSGKQTIERESATYVYYDFKELTPKAAELKLTIVIQMPKFFFKLMAMLFGQEKMWGCHLWEELNNMKDIIEQKGK